MPSITSKKMLLYWSCCTLANHAVCEDSACAPIKCRAKPSNDTKRNEEGVLTAFISLRSVKAAIGSKSQGTLHIRHNETELKGFQVLQPIVLATEEKTWLIQQ